MSDKEIQALYDKANDFFYNNDYDNAQKIYLEILEKDKDHYLSYEKLSKIEKSRNNLKKSTEYLEKALNIHGENASGWNDIGNIYFDLRDFDSALKSYKKAIEIDDQFYWSYYNIGLSLIEFYPGDASKKKEALDWYLKAIKIKDDYYPALNEIGLYYLDTDDLDKAEEYLVRSIKSNEMYKYSYYNLSKVYKKKGDSDKSKLFLVKALKCDPSYNAAYNNLGIMFYDDNDYFSSLYYYTKALEIDNKYKYSLYNIGLVFDRIEEYKKAYETQVKALQSDPNYQPAIDEKLRLEKERADEIKNGQSLKDEDLKPATYKDRCKFVNENVSLGVGTTSSTTPSNNQSVLNTEGDEKKDELYAEKFGRNITKMARDGKLFDVKGRDKEIRSILEVLYKIKKNNPILVGKAGVGKTAIVEGLAQKIAKGDAPDFFKDKEIIEINMGLLIAGTTYRGDFEKRLTKIIDESVKNPNIILFIDEIHTVLGAGETTDSSLDAANILKPALARGELRCIGATTTEEYQRYFQKDPAFERRFYKIDIDELDALSTYDILKDLKPKMEKHYKITISDENMKLIVNLSAEEIKNRAFPDKAIDILEKSFSRCALDNKTEVDETSIVNIVGEFVGVKFIEAEEDKGKRLLEMEKYLKERIYGQDEAIDKISNMIRMTKQRLDLKPEQPDGVFFFAGPTGVGKTYLAKMVAAFLFGNEDKLITLNMSEFVEAHSISKLIGSPPGYIGHEEASFFADKILNNPSCVLLLDEVEKAHPEVMKVFLQIFDEGKITDNKRRTTYFSNVTIIMTSNAVGVKQTSLGFGSKVDKSEIQLTEVFPIELVNRIDEVVIFNYIDEKVAKNILTNLIINKSVKIFEKRGIEIRFDTTFIDHILQTGYDKRFGVRNLERTFEKELMTTVSRFLFEKPNVKIINVTAENGGVKIF